MSYSGATAASSVANPPRLLSVSGLTVGGVGPVGATYYLTTQGSTATNAAAPGNQGCQLWGYTSTNLTTDIVAANFFTDGYYIGMKPGDLVQGAQFTSQGSSVVTFYGAVTSVSTNGASLSTGSLITSTFS